MKGPLESRHTSSERARPTAREHARRMSDPGARSEPRRARAANGCARRSVGVHPHAWLRAPDVCDASIRARRGEDSLSGWTTRGGHSDVRRAAARRRRSCVIPTHRAWRGRRPVRAGATRPRCRHTTRAPARRAPCATPLRTASRRAQRPVASGRFIACTRRFHQRPAQPRRPVAGDAAVIAALRAAARRAAPGRRNWPARARAGTG